MEKHEVVIVRADPGGLKAAQTLAKQGKKDVLVLERLPEDQMGDKICHRMMFPNSMAILSIPAELTNTSLNDAEFYWADKEPFYVKIQPSTLLYVAQKRFW